MSCYVEYTLNATHMTPERAAELAERLELDEYDLLDGNFWNGWDSQSYSYCDLITETLCTLCKQWPDVLFELYTKADSDECFYKTEFENGKKREFTTCITYELRMEVTL